MSNDQNVQPASANAELSDEALENVRGGGISISGPLDGVSMGNLTGGPLGTPPAGDQGILPNGIGNFIGNVIGPK